MRINTKFKPDQEVWYVKAYKRTIRSKCNLCDGEGTLHNKKGKQVGDCPICRGTGKRSNEARDHSFAAAKCKVEKISVRVWTEYGYTTKKHVDITYSLAPTRKGYGIYTTLDEEEIYDNREDAVADAKERNANRRRAKRLLKS